MSNVPPPTDGPQGDGPPADPAPLWPAPERREPPPPAGSQPPPPAGSEPLSPAGSEPPSPASSQPRPPTGKPPRPRGRDGWPPWTAWTAILAGFAATIVGGAIVSIFAAAAGGSLSDPSPGVNIGLTFFQNLALVGAALAFAHIAGRPLAADFGLRSPAADAPDRRARRRALRRAVGLLLGLWVGFYAFSAIWAVALSLSEEQTLPDELGIEGSALNLALVVLLITVMAPVGEEIFFRGYFFGALRNWKGFWPAAIITGLVFGAIHVGSSPIAFTVPLAFFGFALCLLYQRTGSLYPCIALHALNNSVALGVMQEWSWQIPLLMVGAVIASLTVAALLARALAARAQRGAGPFAQSTA